MKLKFGETKETTNEISQQSNTPEDDSKLQIIQNNDPEPPYTRFTSFDKNLVVMLTAGMAFWSSAGSPIYYPALNIIESKFGISQEMVNISVVLYMVFQGLSPSIIGSLADTFGKRPVLLANLIIFTVMSALIGVVDNYAGLLVLRCIQSASISPAIAVSAGIVADFTLRSERGWYVGLTTGIAMMGQGFGALMGAGLIAGWDWRAIFWFLTIGGGITFLFNFIFLPETKRALVGNCSVIPKRFYSRAPVLLLPRYKKVWHLDNPDINSLAPKIKPDYLATFRIIIVPEVALCLLCGAVHYGLWTVLLTCLTSQLEDKYSYSVMQIGLCYLPAGIGGVFGSLFCGKALDLVYRVEFNKHKEKIETGKIPEDTAFNILRARIIVAFPYTILTNGFAIMYGWCLQKQQHIATILVSEFFVCMGCMALVGLNLTLLVDLYPSNSAAASSAVNLSRCLAGALFVAVLTTMNKSMTIGGTFTLMAALGVLSSMILIIPMKYGIKWKTQRQLRKEKIKE